MGKPLDLSCVMKLTASQLNSKSVQVSGEFPCKHRQWLHNIGNVSSLPQTSVLDHTYELLVEYFVINSHSIAFPELVLPTLAEVCVMGVGWVVGQAVVIPLGQK